MTKKVTIIEPVRKEVIKNLRPKKRVCGYARVSTGSNKQNQSYTSQVDYYKSYIEKNNEWEFVGIYADEAKSGKEIDKRDDFVRMISNAKKGKIDLIITKSITRFARNTVDSIRTIRELKNLNVGVYFEKERINTLSQNGEQMLTILSSLAQGESENISQNNRWGIQKRFKDGTYNIPCLPYGFTKSSTGEIIINEKEATVIKRIFSTYLNGLGSYAIAKDLDVDGIETIGSSSKWNEGTIKDILKNPIYKGDLLLQKTYTTDTFPYEKKKNNGQKDQYLIKENHQPIISETEFDLVQELIYYRKTQYRQRYNIEKYNNRYEFSGKIECECCGNVYRRQKIYIGKPYERVQWTCKTHITNINFCKMKAVRDEDIKNAFLTMWNKLVSNHVYILSPLLQRLKEISLDISEKQKLENINNKMKELTEQSLILSRVIAKGYIDTALFIKQNNSLNIEIEELKKQRNNLLNDNSFEKEIEDTKRLLSIIKNNPELMDAYDENLFIHVVEKVIITENGNIRFVLINGLEFEESI